MQTNQRASPAATPRTSCAGIARRARVSKASRAESLFSQLHRALLVLMGLVSMIVTPGVDAAPSQSSSLARVAQATLESPDSPLPFAPVASVDFAPTNVRVGETSDMTITLSNSNATDIVGVQLVDNYPNGIINISGVPVLSDTCGFIEDVSNGSAANLSNGTIPGGAWCSIVIEVVGTEPTIADNHTGVITSSNAPDGADASAILTVGLAAPIVEKSFDPGGIYLGGTSRMTIKLTNPNAVDSITGARFTDDYPSGISNAASGTIVSNTCGGSLDAQAGGTTVALVGGTIPANDDSCSVVINIEGTSAGFTVNHTGAVDSDNALSGADATGVVVVNNTTLVNAPDVTQTFLPATVGPGSGSQMTITFGNPNAEPIFGVQLDDLYPTGMINASGNPVVSDTCNFNHDVPGDGGWAKLSGGTIPVGAPCSIVINVVADVMAATTLTNTTGPIVSGNAQSNAGATAVLTVDSNAPTVTCVLPNEVDIVGDVIDIDLASLFTPPPGQSLIYGVTNPPTGVSLAGSLLTGTLATAGTFTTTLMATTAVPGGMTASEDVVFDVLPLDELVFRDGFGDPATPCN